MTGERSHRRPSSSTTATATATATTVQALVLRVVIVIATCTTNWLECLPVAHGRALGTFGSSQHPPLNLLIDQHGTIQRLEKNSNTTNPFLAISAEALERERHERRQRMRERRDKARRILAQSPPPPPEQLERVDAQYLRRHLNWFGSTDGTSNSLNNLADPSQSYDKWSQAYRMLGGMIDCDHDKDQGSNHGGKNNNNGQTKEGACSRWMLWAAYVNPNYQGNGYDEYFGDNPTSKLDCHQPDTNWVLLGVYRQEFYQYIEQISKHLWAIDEYEYVVALAGLKYMTKSDCFYVGATSSGTSIYAGVAPQPYGKFKMALYTDDYCLTPDTSLGMTYDDFGLQSNIYLGSKDKTNDDTYDWAKDWWYNTQEYTLTQLNDVYEEYKYCTTCVDYPTYQDGYVIGDTGKEDGNLINQCWKFYSHDSYTCEAECIAMAHAQGTIMPITYGETTFGSAPSGFYTSSASAASASASSSYSSVANESPFQRLLANAALTAAFLLFVATFLAFAVARRTRYRESRSMKGRRLLDDDDAGRLSKSRSRGGKSRATSATEDEDDDEEDVEGDGLFRTSSRKVSSSSRSKSASRRDKTTTSSSRKSSSGRSSSRKKRSRSYEPPKDAVTPRSSKSGANHKAEEYF